MRTNLSKLVTIDRHFVIDEFVLKEITGEGSAALLKETFEQQCLPGLERGDAVQALARAETLLASPACRWTNSKLRGELESAKLMLGRLDAKEPIAPAGQRSGWLLDFLAKMSNFLSVDLPGEDGQVMETKFGKEALAWLWDDVTKKPDAGMKEYAVMNVWSHLLSPAQLEVLREKRGAVLAKAKDEMHGMKRDQAQDKARAKRSRKAKRDTEAELDEATRALLGMTG